MAGFSITPRTVIASQNWTGYTAVDGAILSLDPTYYKTNTTQSLKVQIVGGFGRVNVPAPSSPSLTLRQMGQFGIWIYTDNPTVTNITLRLASDGTGTTDRYDFSWGPTSFKFGWNCITVNVQGTALTNPGGASWTVLGSMTLDSIVNFVQIQVALSNNAPVWLDSLYYGERNRPKIMIGFDDAADSSKNTIALPLLNSYGFKAYLAGDGDVFAANQTNLNALYSAGWDIIQSGIGHISYGTSSSTAALLALDFNTAQSIMSSLNYFRNMQMFAYPLSSQNSDTQKILTSKRILLARAANRPSIPVTPYSTLSDFNYIGSVDMGGKTLATMQSKIDTAILYGESLITYVHQLIPYVSGVRPPANTLQWYSDDFDSWLAYIKQKERLGLLDVVTPTEFILSFLSGK